MGRSAQSGVLPLEGTISGTKLLPRIGYDARIKCAKTVLQKRTALAQILVRVWWRSTAGSRLTLRCNNSTRFFLAHGRLCFMSSTRTLISSLGSSFESVIFMLHGWICSSCCDIAPRIPKHPSERDGYDALLKQDEDSMLQLDHSNTGHSTTTTTPSSSFTHAPRHHIADRSHSHSFSKKRRASILAGRSSSTGPEIDGEQQLLIMRHGHRQDEEQRSWHETAEHPWNPPLSALGRQQVRTSRLVCCRHLPRFFL